MFRTVWPSFLTLPGTFCIGWPSSRRISKVCPECIGVRAIFVLDEVHRASYATEILEDVRLLSIGCGSFGSLGFSFRSLCLRCLSLRSVNLLLIVVEMELQAVVHAFVKGIEQVGKLTNECCVGQQVTVLSADIDKYTIFLRYDAGFDEFFDEPVVHIVVSAWVEAG